VVAARALSIPAGQRPLLFQPDGNNTIYGRGALANLGRSGESAAARFRETGRLTHAQRAGTERKHEGTDNAIYIAVLPDEYGRLARFGGKRANQESDLMRVAESALKKS
jgi:hypothetical protein